MRVRVWPCFVDFEAASVCVETSSGLSKATKCLTREHYNEYVSIHKLISLLALVITLVFSMFLHFLKSNFAVFCIFVFRGFASVMLVA